MKKLIILAALCLILFPSASLAAWGDYDNSSYTAYWDAAKGVWTTDKADIAPYGQCSDCDGHILIYEVSGDTATMSWENAKGDIIPLHGIETVSDTNDAPYVPEDNSDAGTSIGKLKAEQKNPDSATLTLSWENATADGYVLEKKDGSAWKRIAVTSDPSCIDASVVTGAAYEYRVKPYKSSAKGRTYGSYSSVLKVTPIVFAEIVPTNLRFESTESSITLTWSKVDAASGYRVERSDGANTVTYSVSGKDSNTYIDTGASMGSSYTYKVFGVAGDKSTRASAPVIATLSINLDGQDLVSALKAAPYNTTMTSFMTDTNKPSAPKANAKVVKTLGGKPVVWIDDDGDNTYTLRSAGSVMVTGSIDKMFSNFASLKSADFSGSDMSGVTSINNVFYECSSLTSAPEIPDGVERMQSAFANCHSLTTAPEIPDSVIFMGYAFLQCESLESAPTIPVGVKDVQYAFKGCVLIKSAPEIPSSVTTSMYNAFYGCASLTSAGAVRAPKTTDVGYAYAYTKLVPSARPDLTGYKGANTAFIGCPDA